MSKNKYFNYKILKKNIIYVLLLTIDKKNYLYYLFTLWA